MQRHPRRAAGSHETYLFFGLHNLLPERLTALAPIAMCISLAACGGGGSDDKADLPTLSLSSSQTSTEFGGATQLNWSSTAATSCTASGAWSGIRATSGQENSAALTDSSTFTLRCTGAGGEITRSATVSVPALPPDPGEIGMASLAGTDSNGNSVRDDAERHILQTTAPGDERRVLLERAKALQAAMSDQSLPESKTESLFRNLECLHHFDPDQASDRASELLAVLVNTPQRANAYFDFTSSGSGQVIELREDSALESACQ